MSATDLVLSHKDWSPSGCLSHVCLRLSVTPLPSGYDNPEVLELMRMYQTIHSDHEVGENSSIYK